MAFKLNAIFFKSGDLSLLFGVCRTTGNQGSIYRALQKENGK